MDEQLEVPPIPIRKASKRSANINIYLSALIILFHVNDVTLFDRFLTASPSHQRITLFPKEDPPSEPKTFWVINYRRTFILLVVQKEVLTASNICLKLFYSGFSIPFESTRFYLNLFISHLYKFKISLSKKCDVIYD